MSDFLESLLSMNVCMCVCLCVCVCVCVFICVSAPRLLITSGMIWTSYDWLNKLYSFYMATAFVINSRRGLRIEVCRGN